MPYPTAMAITPSIQNPDWIYDNLGNALMIDNDEL